MKICPNCNQTYSDDTLNYCLNDGTVLIFQDQKPFFGSNQPNFSTPKNPQSPFTSYTPGQITQPTAILRPRRNFKGFFSVLIIAGLLIFACSVGLVGLYYYLGSQDFSSQPERNPNTENEKPENQGSNITKESKKQDDPDGLTMEKYLQLKMGSSYKEAVKVIGKEGVSESSSKIAGKQIDHYKWQDDALISIRTTFENDKLMTKMQMGLNKETSATLSLENFNKLKNNMSYNEVKEILGEGGEVGRMSILKNEGVTYQWKGENYSLVSATFLNDKLNSISQAGLN